MQSDRFSLQEIRDCGCRLSEFSPPAEAQRLEEKRYLYDTLYTCPALDLEHRKAGAPSPFPPGLIEIEIPDAHHHIMIDQPLALVAAIRALLSVWPT